MMDTNHGSIRHRFQTRATYLGLSQVEIARRMEVAPQNLTSALTVGRPRLTTLRKMASALAVPVGYFLDNGCPKCGVTWEVVAVGTHEHEAVLTEAG